MSGETLLHGTTSCCADWLPWDVEASYKRVRPSQEATDSVIGHTHGFWWRAFSRGNCCASLTGVLTNNAGHHGIYIRVARHLDCALLPYQDLRLPRHVADELLELRHLLRVADGDDRGLELAHLLRQQLHVAARRQRDQLKAVAMLCNNIERLRPNRP